MSDLVESIFSDMPTVGSKISLTVRDIVQTVLWVVSYPRKLWTPAINHSDRARAQMNFFYNLQ